MHYNLEVSGYTTIVNIEVHLVQADIEILFSAVCYFSSHFCWAVNCISWSQ